MLLVANRIRNSIQGSFQADATCSSGRCWLGKHTYCMAHGQPVACRHEELEVNMLELEWR